jgi:hypothetical protein
MKIIEELLKVKFPTVNTDMLMEIINATPNPILATEIMCGIFVEPTVGSHKRVEHKSRGLCIFKSFNKWDNQVTYSYEEVQTKGAYFPKGTKKEDVTMENFDELSCSSNTEDCVYLHIPNGKTYERTGNMSFDEWMSLSYVPTEIEEKILNQQKIYE